MAIDPRLTREDLERQKFDFAGDGAVRVTFDGGGASDGSIVDGADSGIKATVFDLTNSNPLSVAIVDGDGDQISSFGGGVQYADGTSEATPTGTAQVFDDGGVMTVVSDTNPLPVLASIDTTGLATENKQDDIITAIGAIPGGGGQQYDVDDVAGASDTGTLGLLVRDDALTTLTPADGDYTQGRTNSRGAQWVVHDGEITAALSATDNAVLDAIAASVAAIDTDTTTLIGHVDGIEALLTTIDGRVDGIEALIGTTNTTLSTIDGRVDGIESLLTAIDGHVDGIEGSVDGIEGLLTTIDADTGSIMTAVQLIDDVIFTDDAAFTPGASKVAAIGFLADETASDSVDEGDIGASRMTLDRKQHVVAEQESNSMRIGGVAVVPKFVAIAASSSGNNTVLAAVTSKKIRVLGYVINANGTVNAKFQSGASGTDLTGLIYMVVNTGAVVPVCNQGWFETASNTLLNLNLSAAVAVGGHLVYIEV